MHAFRFPQNLILVRVEDYSPDDHYICQYYIELGRVYIRKEFIVEFDLIYKKLNEIFDIQTLNRSDPININSSWIRFNVGKDVSNDIKFYYSLVKSKIIEYTCLK